MWELGSGQVGAAEERWVSDWVTRMEMSILSTRDPETLDSSPSLIFKRAHEAGNITATVLQMSLTLGLRRVKVPTL